MIATRDMRYDQKHTVTAGWSPAISSLGVVLVFCAVIAGCREKSPLEPVPQVRYIAFGDSRTKGPAERNYWEFLCEMLDESPNTFANEGRGGEMAPQGLARLQMLLKHNVYPNATILLYWEGAGDMVHFIQHNDPQLKLSPDDPDYPLRAKLTKTLDRAEDTIEQAIKAAQDSGLQVYVMTSYLISPNITKHCDATSAKVLLPAQINRANAYGRRLNQRIRLVAERSDAILIDLEPVSQQLNKDADNYFDSKHLSAKGNRIIAEAVLKVIKANRK